MQPSSEMALPIASWTLESDSTAARSLAVSRQAITSAPLKSKQGLSLRTIRWKELDCDTIEFPLAPPLVSITGCVFSPGAAFSDGDSRLPAQTGEANRPVAKNSTPVPGPRGRTRVRPPRDIVKLEDRLRYLLEPPLESILETEGLSFAYPPFPYQLDGIAFLAPRHEAVLADEMGLGKTMQAVSAIRLLIHQQQLRRVLLICPKPLVNNWQQEFSQWAPELPITTVEGQQHRRAFLWQQTAPVTISNYETIVRDSQMIAELAGHFDLVLLDEAQRIKNSSGATSQAVRRIPRTRSWALTGTPIENSADDVVGIFEFVLPGHLRSGMKISALRGAVTDHVLRRTKDRVLSEMPPKLFRDAQVELTAEQQIAYKLAEDEGVLHLREIGKQLSIQHVFELIIRLKQICNFDPATGSSSKLERLEADLEECATSGRKALVFSQWVDTLDELQRRLKRFNPMAYHGRIPHRRRQGVIEQFRDDDNCHVLLMSYGAGGVGLNLQFAGYVFLYDRWWNPAVEDQAINRAHRIGAAGPVTVTRFLTMGTIEERINQILEEKRDLFDSVFGDDLPGTSGGLSQEEIFSLFDLG